MSDEMFSEGNGLRTKDRNAHQCKICGADVHLTDKEIIGRRFLKDLRDVGEGGEVCDAPAFRVREICAQCTDKLIRENFRRQLQDILDGTSDEAGERGMCHVVRHPRVGKRISENETLPLSRLRLRPPVMRGMAEKILGRKLPRIEAYFDMIFADFPGIEKNEFFKYDMEAVMDYLGSPGNEFGPEAPKDLELRPYSIKKGFGKKSIREHLKSRMED